MRLILASTFVARHFDPECAPHPKTVREWVRTGAIAGKQVGKLIYVDEDAFLDSLGDRLADKISNAA